MIVSHYQIFAADAYQAARLKKDLWRLTTNLGKVDLDLDWTERYRA